jgi:hypothetical protein
VRSSVENLRIALWVAIGALVLSVLPIWPYGAYTMLRLVVTAVSLFALYVLGTGDPRRTIGLAAVALLFNPLVPVHLSRLLWFPIDLGVAYWFWIILDRHVSRSSSRNDEASPRPSEPAI